MRKFRRRDIRTVRRLAKVLATLDEQAALARPGPRRIARTQLGVSGR